MPLGRELRPKQTANTQEQGASGDSQYFLHPNSSDVDKVGIFLDAWCILPIKDWKLAGIRSWTVLKGTSFAIPEERSHSGIPTERSPSCHSGGAQPLWHSDGAQPLLSFRGSAATLSFRRSAATLSFRRSAAPLVIPTERSDEESENADTPTLNSTSQTQTCPRNGERVRCYRS
jgi:hypothetical protein